MKKLFSVVLAFVMLFSTFTVVAFADKTENAVSVKEGETVSFSLTAEKSAGYCIKIEYTALSGRSVSPKVAVTVDGKYDGNEKDVYEFSRIWSDVRKGERFKTDDFGNELSPTPEEVEKSQEKLICPQDENWKTGFKLKKGEHKIYMLQNSRPTQ